MLRLELETPEPASQGQCPQATSQQLLSATCDHISILYSTLPNPGPSRPSPAAGDPGPGSAAGQRRCHSPVDRQSSS